MVTCSSATDSVDLTLLQRPPAPVPHPSATPAPLVADAAAQVGDAGAAAGVDNSAHGLRIS